MSPRRSKTRSRYRVVNGISSVELKLRTPRQLFDERDPAPFRERDLNDDAARYIRQSFRELKDQDDVKLQLYFETLDELEDRPHVIGEAIHAFFRFETAVKSRELRDNLRMGMTALLVGISFLFTCTLIYHGIITIPGLPAPLQLMIKEGAMIMGYVSMWKPLSIFLYDWWPIRAEQLQLRELTELEIDVLSSDGELLWSTSEAIDLLSKRNINLA